MTPLNAVHETKDGRARKWAAAFLCAASVFAGSIAATTASDTVRVSERSPKAKLTGFALNLSGPVRHPTQINSGDIILGPTFISAPARTPSHADPVVLAPTPMLPKPALKQKLNMPVQQLDNQQLDKTHQTKQSAPGETERATELAQAQTSLYAHPAETELAWRKNAVPVSLVPNKPRIVVVIDDLGIRKEQTREAIDIDAPLTLAFLPYATHVAEQAKLAHARGHELMVHVPMQPMGPENPGPNALRTDLSNDELKARLDWSLSQFDGYVGANNHMGSKFTQYTPGLDTVMAEIKQRGLLFLDSVTGPSRAYRSANAAEVPFIKRDVFIDHFINEVAIRKYLKQLEMTALRQGYAIGIGHPHEVTLRVLKEWLPEVQARGFQIVPISAVMREQQQTIQAQADHTPALQQVAQTEHTRAGF